MIIMAPKKRPQIYDNREQAKLTMPDEDVQYVLNNAISLAKFPLSSINDALEQIKKHPLREDPKAKDVIADVTSILENIQQRKDAEWKSRQTS